MAEERSSVFPVLFTNPLADSTTTTTRVTAAQAETPPPPFSAVVGRLHLRPMTQGTVQQQAPPIKQAWMAGGAEPPPSYDEARRAKKKEAMAAAVADDNSSPPPTLVMGARRSASIDTSSSLGSSSGSADFLADRLKRYRRRASCMMVLATLLLVLLGVFVVGGVYAWHRYNRIYHGSCQFRLKWHRGGHHNKHHHEFEQENRQIPAARLLGGEQSAVRAASVLTSDDVPQLLDAIGGDGSGGGGLVKTNNNNGAGDTTTINEEYALDMVNQLWAMLTTPKLPDVKNGHAARFIHDFNMNLTAIMDLEQMHCYVMPLNRSLVKPPKDLYEFFVNMDRGKYDLDPKVIEQSYYVDPFPIVDYQAMGPYISDQCYAVPSFWLVEKKSGAKQAARHSLFRRRKRHTTKSAPITFFQISPADSEPAPVMFALNIESI